MRLGLTFFIPVFSHRLDHETGGVGVGGTELSDEATFVTTGDVNL